MSQQVKAPPLWIKEFYILKAYDLQQVIRHVSFTPGLNCIVGLNSKAPSHKDIILGGHSVGKTSLCRLLRYALTENPFATGQGVRAIQEIFPHAYIAAEVYINNTQWSVLRPLGASGKHIAYQGSLQDAFTKGTEEEFTAYCAALQDLVPSCLQNTSFPFAWSHLLAWLSRDQESRLHTLHGWRSEDSECHTPKFPKPVIHPNYLISAMLGLINSELATLNEQYLQGEKKLEKLKIEIKAASEEPSYKLRFAKEQLEAIIGNFQDIKQQGHLLDANNVARQVLENIENRILKLSQELEGIKEQHLEVSFNIKKQQENWERLKEMLDMTSVQEGETPLGIEGKRQEKERLEAQIQAKQECPLFTFRLNECSYILRHVENLRLLNFDDYKREKAIKNMDAQSKAELEALERQQKEQNRRYAQAQESKRELEDKIRECKIQLDSAKQEKNRVEICLNSYLEAHAELAGEKHTSELATLTNKQEELQQELKQIVTEQENHRQSLQGKAKRFNELFSNLVKTVLGENFSGNTHEHQGKWSVTILQDKRGAGQTYATIGNILFDVAAALFTGENEGQHPGFFIFDSPRETDMDDTTYANLMHTLYNLHTLRQNIDIPFQCILTSTTPPPKDVQNTVRLELAAYPSERLLFRRELHRDGLV